jgi:V/A-type H+/Na+-transporting ATPase subunit D
MPPLRVSPTKANLLRIRRDLEFAREGYEMLEQKRKILVLELMGMVESARRIQQEVNDKMAKAYAALNEAFIRAGTLGLAVNATAPRAPHEAEINTRSLMGINLARLTPEHERKGPAVSLLAGTTALDEAAAAFTAALESVDRLAEIENAVFRLAREVRKTQRRVNALEKIFIPAYQETVKFIAAALEERERDAFVIMKMVKERLVKSRAQPA